MAAGSPPRDQEVGRLSSGRWLIPILAQMSRDGGARFGVLVRQLGISRSVLSRHLEALQGFGWLARNPGHGHPLRPEYLLTSRGAALAAWCARVMAQREQLGLERRAFGRWSLPVVFAVEAEAKTFSGLQTSLAPVTPRALSLTLHQLRDAALLERSSERYGLTGRGREFAGPLLSAA